MDNEKIFQPKGTVSAVLSEARASISSRPSLQNPSRPFTPRDINRPLFHQNEYLTRPSTSYSSLMVYKVND